MSVLLADHQIIQGVEYKGDWALTWPEPVDDWPALTAATISFTLKAETTPERFTCSGIDADGQVKVELDALTTVDFDPGLYQYRLIAEARSGPQLLAEGRVRVRPALT